MTSVKSGSLAYKVGLGVIVVGGVIAASSWLLGGVTFSAVSALLRLLGAPDDRALLPPHEPEAGGQLLQLFGVILFVCGICIVGIRLVVELLGLAGKPELTRNLDRADKLGLGAAALGLLAIVPAGLSQVMLYEIFLYEYGRGAAMFTLDKILRVGAAILFVGLAVLILRRRSRRRMLLGWTDRVGWGKIGCGWINKLGLGLIALGWVGTTLTLWTADTTSSIVAVGIGILIAGIVPHILAILPRGRP